VQKRIPEQAAATVQALPPPSGNAGCEGSSDLGSRPASWLTVSSGILLCSLRGRGSGEGLEDMVEYKKTS
jgi:hypothetical protein